jgi:2,4-dienoyl-CoA reductase-like NADH-dependent reductase (Old Yellow Enzyme family)
VIADYVHAAENAKKAGFDGVQLHGANGYLIDQFLRNGSNLRDDDYGGPVENRIRLLREVTEALIGVWGKGRVSVRLSPNGATQGVDDSAPEKLFPVAAAALDALGIGFLELREPGPDGTFGNTDVPKQSPAIRAAFKGPLILNSDYNIEKAEAALASGLADAIAFGRPFIGNPDLVERIAAGAEWAADNPKTWYSPGAEGYTDYPALVNA